MILKGSQRAGGSGLAAHLMNLRDNEHVHIHELRGFCSDNLKGAFKEAEAVALGTRCSQYLFSLSLSPPEKETVGVGVFENAIETIETKLGLQGQPRAIVFHEKEGRRHAHCVWSRIDADTMTARKLSHFKMKLMDVSRKLYLDHGWKMPRGLANVAERDPTNFTLAEWQQAKRQNADPRWIKQLVQDAWAKSDNAKSLARALEDRGYVLAKGDRRSFVVLDYHGEVWSLPRMLGLKSKAVRDRLGEGAGLHGVTEARKLISDRMTPLVRSHIAESKACFQSRIATLGQHKSEMTIGHRASRAELMERHKTEWADETRARANRLAKGLRGLWQRITGRHRETRRYNEDEAARTKLRHAAELQSLIDQQLQIRVLLQAQIKSLRAAQASEFKTLRSDLRRYRQLSNEPSEPLHRLSRTPSLSL